ncbi:hypothetical protein [Microbispora sp. GKU 823]|uniref:hypothetical protein n=1 Tax=Microbispora sp. GKU 823 TaxID=1652100 RepID=UPI0009A2B3FE|nr:hypothetical protein [Microbispora sp. GKU 823]OPG08631.1 hypothetical protein B1L11_27690 [Microbispora sp. GKU 823]
MSEHLARYLETLSRTQHTLSSGFRALRRGHPREPDLCGVCERLAAQCDDHAERLEPFQRRYRSGGSRDRVFDAGGFDTGGFDTADFGAGGFDGGVSTAGFRRREYRRRGFRRDGP